MSAIGIALLWIAYTGGLYGYCLIRGYDISPKQLLSPEWPPGNKQNSSIADAAQNALKNTQDYVNANPGPQSPKFVPNPQGRIR